MGLSEKGVKAILSILLFFTFVQAQNWDVKITYSNTDTSENLAINVVPAYQDEAVFLIDFPQNLLAQNFKEELKTWKLEEGMTEFSSIKAPFKLSNTSGISYEIDLKKSTHIPSKAFLNYGTIQLANWQEILFDCDVDVKLNIEFEKDAQHYDLGVKRLSEWKVSPSKILPTKTLVNVNRINVACNLSSKELQTQIEQTLKPFNYLAKGTDVVIIFANDSMASGGIRYPNLSIVYIDAKTSDSNPKFALQHTLLHELFHSIIPYEINPEEDAEAILENWLAEAVPEYFSLRCLLKNGLITESEFITQMEQKLRTAVKFDGKSLQDMSLNIYRNATYYEAFYSKGCIALFLADLDLYRASKGEFTISDLIIGKFPDLNEEQQGFITQVMYDLEQAIVVNPNSFALNKYLEAYGWLYQKQVVLPYKVGSKTAEIRKENIVMNKTANIEQKSLWEGFIHR